MLLCSVTLFFYYNVNLFANFIFRKVAQNTGLCLSRYPNAFLVTYFVSEFSFYVVLKFCFYTLFLVNLDRQQRNFPKKFLNRFI